MKIRISPVRNATNVLGILAIAVAVAGCELGASPARVGSLTSVRSASAPPQELVETSPPDWYRGEQPILRHRMDVARDRLWVLTLGGVEVYDARTRERLAHNPLSHWLWAGEPYSCAPDLALGPRGEALISSNVVPKLWRVDPVSFSVSEHELVLDADTDRDVGFSGMAYSPEQGVYFAVSNPHGSLWRIDPLLQRAQKIPLSSPIPNACALTLRLHEVQQKNYRLVGLCVRALNRGRTTDLALLLSPDQRSGYVGTGSCTG